MFKPLSLFIGWRHTAAKRRNHFISFISAVSMLGIALGVMVLITVLSVMNGFDQQIRTRILSMVPQVVVTEWGGKLNNWQELASKLKGKDNIVAMAPFVEGQALLNANGAPAFAVVTGVDPKQVTKVLPIGSKMIAGSLSALKANQFGIVIGQTLANNLGVGIGNKISVIVPQGSLTPVGLVPRLKQFKIVGVFHVGYQYDSSYVLINIHDAAKLFMLGKSVSGLQLKLSNLFLAPSVAAKINTQLPEFYRASSWAEQNQNFFKALKMEKIMMFLILLLIIAVAAFNMLSSLVMLVTDKQADIAILRTLGARSGLILRSFIIQGMTIGVVGTLLGLLFGVLLSANITSLVNEIQKLFHVQFLSSSVYYINFVPSHIEINNLVIVCGASLILSFLATIYPAWRATKVQPAEALRYE